MTRGQTARVDTNALPPISPDWRYESVGALGRHDEQAVLTGPFGTNLGRNDFVEQGVPVLTIGCLTEGGITLDKALYVSEEKARELERYRLREGDLLFSRMASVGRAGMVPRSLEGALFNYHIMRLRLDESQIDPRVFINYVRGARQVRDYLKAVNHGATRDGINTEQLLGMPVAIPPLARQRELVAEIEKQFSRLDEAVANLKRVKANLKRYKAAVLQAAFDGRLLGDVSAGAKPPQDWVWGTCGDVIDSIQAGASFKCVERPPVDGEVGVVKVSAVTWGEFDERESKTCLDPERVKESLFIRPGDFLFSRANTIELVGACVIATTVTKSLMLSDKILRFRLAAGLASEWLLICLQSNSGRAEIERLATGNQESMRNIGQDRIRQIRLPLPPITKQRRIVTEVERRLSVVREVAAEVDADLTRSQALRSATLARFFLDQGAE